MAEDTKAELLGGSEAPTSSPDANQATPEMGEEELNKILSETPTRGDLEDVKEPKAEPQETQKKGGKELSEKAKSRQHKLAQKVKAKDEEVRTLREELEQLKGARDETLAPSAPTRLPWETPQAPEGGVREMTWEEYEREKVEAADQMVRLRLSQYDRAQKRIQQFNDDVVELESSYPELRKGDEKFNEALSKQIVGLYQKAGGVDSGIRLKDFVADVMALRTGSQEEGKEQVTAAMAKQVAGSAVTPSTGTKADRLTSEEELERKLASGEISAEEAEKYLPH